LDATSAFIAWLFGTRSVRGYVADLLDMRNPERDDSDIFTIRPLVNAGRGPPLAPGSWMRLHGGAIDRQLKLLVGGGTIRRITAMDPKIRLRLVPGGDSLQPVLGCPGRVRCEGSKRPTVELRALYPARGMIQGDEDVAGLREAHTGCWIALGPQDGEQTPPTGRLRLDPYTFPPGSTTGRLSGGPGERWVVCGRAGRCRVRRLPAVVFRGLGNVFPPLGFSRAYLVWFGSMIPGLYEFIQCTLSLSE